MSNISLGVSVIICAYTEERWHKLVAAVKSIQQQSTPPQEIIVVIDHNAQLFERVRTHMPDIIAIENSEPQGLSGARNSGIALAREVIIAFLDDDAVAELDWLARLSRYCENFQVLGVGGTSDPLWESKRPAWFPEEFYWVVGCSYRGLPDSLAKVRNPFGGCACYRREVFEVIGGFRSEIGRVGSLPMGCEETELCVRAKQQWPQKFFLYEPQAKIHHHVPSHRASWRYFFSRCYAEGLSKALLARYVGTKDTLAPERTYVFSILLNGAVHVAMHGFLRFDLISFLRAGAILVGLLITIVGYIVGTISRYLALYKGVNTSDCYNFKQLLQQKVGIGTPKR
ncbi:MAG: glycosyltransferase family 2 protein [Ktedonobacteraceae bacterium]